MFLDYTNNALIIGDDLSDFEDCARFFRPITESGSDGITRVSLRNIVVNGSEDHQTQVLGELFDLLKSFKQLTTLEFVNFPFSPSLFGKFLDILKALPHLQFLHFEDCAPFVTSRTLQSIFDAKIRQHQNLLLVSGINLQDHTIQAMCRKYLNHLVLTQAELFNEIDVYVRRHQLDALENMADHIASCIEQLEDTSKEYQALLQTLNPICAKILQAIKELKQTQAVNTARGLLRSLDSPQFRNELALYVRTSNLNALEQAIRNIQEQVAILSVSPASFDRPLILQSNDLVREIQNNVLEISRAIALTPYRKHHSSGGERGGLRRSRTLLPTGGFPPRVSGEHDFREPQPEASDTKNSVDTNPKGRFSLGLSGRRK